MRNSAKDEEIRPAGPPSWLQSGFTRALLLLLTPFVLFLLLLWWLVGLLLTLSGTLVAAFTVILAWTLYLTIPSISTHLLDWPLVLTVGALLSVLTAKSKWAQLGIWLALTVYAIVRVSLLDLEDGSTEKRLVTALAIECCVFPAWLLICNLRLWLPASDDVLEDVEAKIYRKYVLTEVNLKKVAGLGTVHVPYCGDNKQLPPRNIVLMHGYMAGNAFWAANLQALAKSFNVYAVEWRGIGRSVRPTFNAKTDYEIDDFFVESLEQWRREIQLDRFILCAHSMGAMYSTYYATKYSHHIEHLILVSPAGVNGSDTKDEELGGFWRFIAKHQITPMSAIRFAGPFGLTLVQWAMRRRIAWTPPSNIIRSGELDFDQITLYCYHNWALKKSGEMALHTDLHPGASARRTPLSRLLTPATIKVPLTIMYGGGSDWMNAQHGEAVVRSLEKTHYAVFRLVPLAGHQVFMDNPVDFNRMVIEAVHEHERSIAFP
uniref:AB hydrolase-1 domain-containing protein n=1 Tax=Globisporangium ultimum (strain ATCC 200006 / CBS 805.95 / DAOM BR144) TaxID=431595 RepID=K3WZ17_GLOUD